MDISVDGDSGGGGASSLSGDHKVTVEDLYALVNKGGASGGAQRGHQSDQIEHVGTSGPGTDRVSSSQSPWDAHAKREDDIPTLGDIAVEPTDPAPPLMDADLGALLDTHAALSGPGADAADLSSLLSVLDGAGPSSASASASSSHTASTAASTEIDTDGRGTATHGTVTPATGAAHDLIDLTLDDDDESPRRERAAAKAPASYDDDIIIEASDHAPRACPVPTLSRARTKEIEIVEPDDGFICIGQITGIALVINATQEILATPDMPRASRAFPVVLKRVGQDEDGNEMIYIASPASGHFAFLEHKFGNLIGPLVNVGEVPTPHTPHHAAGNHRVLIEGRVHRTTEKLPMMVSVSLLLFSRRSQLMPIAQHFMSHRVFLMNPALYVPAKHNGYELFNPHGSGSNTPAPRADSFTPVQRSTQLPYGAPGRNYPAGMTSLGGLPGLVPRAGPVISNFDPNDPRRNFTPATHFANYNTHDNTTTSTTQQRVPQFDSIFESLKSGVDLEETEPPAIVVTPLYPHQKQALSFLLDRERAVTLDDLRKVGAGSVSLWQPQLDMNCRPVRWRHLAVDMEIPGPDMAPQVRGAILADDMGLGKTLVVISLVASTLDIAREFAREKPTRALCIGDSRVKQANRSGRHSWLFKKGSPIYTAGGELIPEADAQMLHQKARREWEREHLRQEEADHRFDHLVTRSRATLIVCPLSTIQNWESQFDEHVSLATDDKPRLNQSKKGGLSIKLGGKKKLKICVYHGASRPSDPFAIADHDVVITTYSTINTEFAKQRRAANGGQSKKARHDSDDALVLGSSDDDAPKLHSFYAKSGVRGRARPSSSTYTSPLQMVQWHRIVLDEAHVIKEHTTSQAEAACYLNAERRVCLTGTPVQNSLMDLFSLFKFLRVEPFSDRRIWTHYIGSRSPNEAGLQRLQVIMRYITLRRNKESRDKNGKPLLQLPSNTQTRIDLTFSPAELACYQSYHDKYKNHFEMLLKSDQVMKNYCHILQEILRLRQICVHQGLVKDVEDRRYRAVVAEIDEHGINRQRAGLLYLFMRDMLDATACQQCTKDLNLANDEITGDKKKPDDRETKRKSDKRRREEDAGDGDAEPFAAVVTSCEHLFCIKCFRSQTRGNRCVCPMCDTVLEIPKDAVELDLGDISNALYDMVEYSGLASKEAKKTARLDTSTKTQRLINDLLTFSRANPHTKNYVTDPSLIGQSDGLQAVHGESVKSVVFSQWTTMLDRLSDLLTYHHIKFVRLDGTMSRENRDKAIENFKSDNETEVFLISLKAGGVGLNLTVARRVYVFEPYWNPAVEAQAVDRIHRLGQKHEVQTIRYIMSDSIEVRMLQIQERKLELSKMSLTQTLSKEEIAKRRMEDLKIMFS